ncbi:MAG: hypothetical protein AAFZ38_06920 [Myxococcota bacterium]
MASHHAEEALLTDSAVIDPTGEPVLHRFGFMVALCAPVMATAQDRSPIVVPDEDSELDATPSGDREQRDDETAGGPSRSDDDSRPEEPAERDPGGGADAPTRPGSVDARKAPIVQEDMTEPTSQPDEVPDSPKPYRRIELPDAPEMAPEWLGEAVEERRAEREERPRRWRRTRRLRYGDRKQDFQLSVDGFLRFQAGCIYPNSYCGIETPSDEDARRNPLVGRNDLFSLGGARVNLRGRYGDRLYLRLALGGSAVTYDSPDDPVGRYDTGFRDVYVGYQVSDSVAVYAGRFRPPFDSESLTPVEDLFFVNRSLESRGVLRHEGWADDEFNGFSPGRQLGAMLVGDHALTNDEVRLGYQVSVTNGNSGEASLNDNDLPAVYGRLTLKVGESQDERDYHRADEEGPASYRIGEGLRVGLGGFYNEVRTGLPGARFDDRIFGGGIDVAARYSRFIVQGQLLAQRVDRLTVDEASDERGLGGHIQLSLDAFDTGFFPGYRFAALDPRNPTDPVSDIELADNDRVVHHTVGVKWISSSLPLIAFLEYTFALEQEARELPNDRIEAAVQVIFE